MIVKGDFEMRRTCSEYERQKEAPSRVTYWCSACHRDFEAIELSPQVEYVSPPTGGRGRKAARFRVFDQGI